MASFMNKQISQETFDEVVKENIDEFGMSSDDALADAITQFKSQGIDLSIIDTTGGIGRDDITNAISIITDYDGTSRDNINLIITTIMSLSTLVNPMHQMAKRNMSILIKTCWNSIICLMSIQTPKEILVEVLKFVSELCQTDPSCRDAFAPGGNDRACRLLSSSFDPRHLAENVDILCLTLNVIKNAICKTENNKNSAMKLGIGPIISAILREDYKPLGIDIDTLANIQMSVFQVIKGLCLFDDTRRDMSCAYDNGRYFIGLPIVVESMVQAAHKFKQYPALAAAAMSATKQLVLSEEAVKAVANCGGMELPLAVLGDKQSSVELVRSVLGLMRNLCADDERKTRLVNDGTMCLVLQKMVAEAFVEDSTLVEHAMATLAAMALRSPQNGTKIIEANGVDSIIKGMRKHPTKGALQRYACMVIRNIAGRSPELHSFMLDAGIESVIRDASRLQGAVDSAYAALRDLGIDVQYVKLAADGTVQPVYEHFGDNKVTNFSATFDTAHDFYDRVDVESKAPFSGCDTFGNPHNDHDHDHDHQH